ncbi:MAG: hypothetical protein KGM99_00380 [Burkholderiales bacterium]|nr:hypothetical protein [Burkholderiales bacterium]
MNFFSKEKRLQRWANTRRKGLWRFILMNGVLGWGVTTAILWSIFMSMTSQNFDFKTRFPLALVIFPLGGIFWGYFVWRETEKLYQKQLSTE